MASKFFTFCRKKLFSGWWDGLFSVLTLGIVLALVYFFVYWATIQADWSVITNSLRFLMAGGLSITDIWRAWLASALFLFLVGLSLAQINRTNVPRPLGTFVSVAILLLVALILWALGHLSAALTILLCAAAAAGWFSVRFFPGSAWLAAAWTLSTIVMWNILVPNDGRAVGGLLLGTLVTLVAAIASFPLGVLLALGRTSRLPGVRIVCSAYIELVRSLPLISILFWAWMVVPLILPADFRISDVVRGAAGFTLFYAAYVAEYIRGGLQGVSAGQWNAARSLGMKTRQTLSYIVLPQAIRSVLPGLVGNVLDIFNNVPLLFVIGLTEFVRAGQVVLSNPQYSNQLYEVYVFMFAVYLLIATILSWSSRVVERSLNTGR
jgi:general L-amino acid transport system permease protein